MTGLIREPVSTLITRRAVLAGLIAAPAIVRVTSLMPVRGVVLAIERPHAGFVERLGYQWMDSIVRPGSGSPEDQRGRVIQFGVEQR